MRYQHDCDNCKPLGEHGDADLYFCDQGGAGITVIARYSSDGADYTSGLCAAPFVPDLGEAKKRAVALGLLTPNDRAKGRAGSFIAGTSRLSAGFDHAGGNMKICKARITQCSGRMYWYRAMVGKEVFATRQHGESDLGFRMIFVGAFDSTPPSGSYFNAKDLEIIEEFDGDIVERVTVEVVRKVGADNTALVGSNVEVRGAASHASPRL